MNFLYSLSLLILIVVLVGLVVSFHWIFAVRTPERYLHTMQETCLVLAAVILLVARARTIFDSEAICDEVLFWAAEVLQTKKLEF